MLELIRLPHCSRCPRAGAWERICRILRQYRSGSKSLFQGRLAIACSAIKKHLKKNFWHFLHCLCTYPSRVKDCILWFTLLQKLGQQPQLYLAVSWNNGQSLSACSSSLSGRQIYIYPYHTKIYSTLLYEAAGNTPSPASTQPWQVFSRSRKYGSNSKKGNCTPGRHGSHPP